MMLTIKRKHPDYKKKAPWMITNKTDKRKVVDQEY